MLELIELLGDGRFIDLPSDQRTTYPAARTAWIFQTKENEESFVRRMKIEGLCLYIVS
jgi:hypothetical protein